MSGLAPNLFNRRFQDLVEMGRAQLPGLAPDWTDHNAHDPGITLMELLAWVAEAQLYSLGHTRRDERTAYAALLGLAPEGTRPACGLIWPDHLDPQAPGVRYAQSVVIPTDAVVYVLNAETLTFRPAHKLLWVPGRIGKLTTRLADGRILDHTIINERGDPAFQPFGEVAGQRDVLVMEFECRSDGGLFPAKREDAAGAHWVIGVRADKPITGGAMKSDEPATARRSSLAATLVTDTDRFPLDIVSDSTDGLLRTGALVLDLSNVTLTPKRFAIELRSSQGFERPPRLLRIEPNVVPIVQGRSIHREVHVVEEMPNWSFQLDIPGLRFAAFEAPVKVEVDDAKGLNEWQRCDRLSDSGPSDRVYEFDVSADRITFGNGINGRFPAVGTQVLVTYAVSDGAQGGVARNRKWRVAGFGEVFGVNPDPVTGGAAPKGWIEQRREARHRARDEHALVSSSDIAAAARALPLLEVARAWVVPPGNKLPRTGAVTLVVMRGRPSDKEPEKVPETQRWLEAIRRRLVTQMPLGTRLVVMAPRYVEFFIRATLDAASGRDPSTIKKAVESELCKRLIKPAANASPRQPGVPVTSRDLAGWIQAVDGVWHVVALSLVHESGQAVDEIKVPRGGLPRFNLSRSIIDVKRMGQGATP